MSDKLTPEQIAAIRKRLEAATPGPWVDVLYEDDTQTEALDVVHAKNHKCWIGSIAGPSDAEFIAAAPTDIAALLAHIAALDAELAAAREENARLRKVAEAARTVFERAAAGEYLGESIVLAEHMNPLSDALETLDAANE